MTIFASPQFGSHDTGGPMPAAGFLRSGMKVELQDSRWSLLTVPLMTQLIDVKMHT
jgi:hypothetical protein